MTTVSRCDGKSVPLKFVIYDDQSTPATAVSLHEKLVTVDQVDVLVGVEVAAGVRVLVGGGVKAKRWPKIPVTLPSPTPFQTTTRFPAASTLASESPW